MKFDLGHIAKITVIHIVLTAHKPVYHFVVLKKVKGEIEFGKRQCLIRDFKILIKSIPKNYPVLLHFSGKGILNRKVTRQKDFKQSLLLNVNLDDFYFSNFETESLIFSSIMRKDKTHEFIATFEAEKFHVISISSGPFHSAILYPFLNSLSLGVAEYELEFEDKKLIDFTKDEAPNDNYYPSLKLGDDQLSYTLIVCAAAGVAFFNPQTQVQFPESEEVFTHHLYEAKQKQIFVRFGFGMMCFFLVLLFANYLYVGNLNQKVMDNSILLDESSEQRGMLADLEEEVDRKENLLQSSGLLSRNFLSFYLMELTNSVPDQITLDELNIRPLADEIKPRQKVAFEDQLILVNGRTKNSQLLSRWIEKLENFEWLAHVVIVSYEYIKNAGVFKLEIELN